MKLTKQTAIYEVEGAKKPLRFFVFADLHANDEMGPEILPALVEAAKKAEPHSIFFLGDLVHTVQYLDNPENFQNLKNFLDEMAEVAPLYIIIGNHDIRFCDEETDLAYVVEPTEFWKAVEQNPRIKLLRNQEIETEDFYVAGMEQSAECYGLKREGGMNRYQRSILVAERPKAMRVELDKFLRKLHIPKTAEKPRILLLHSARFLGWREMRKWVTDFDVIMSGHLHNMAIPPKAFDKTMRAYGLSPKKGHFVCPPVFVFISPKYRDRYKHYYAILKIKPS